MDDVIKMSTNNEKRSGLPQEHHQQVRSSSESRHGFKCMKWDKDEYIRVYHILFCWLNMTRVVVVNKDRDVFGVIIVDI